MLKEAATSPWGPDRRWWDQGDPVCFCCKGCLQVQKNKYLNSVRPAPQWSRHIRPGQTLSAYALSKKQAGLGVPQQLLASITCPPGPDTRQEVTTERCPVIVKKIKSIKQLRKALHFSFCSRKVPEYGSCLLRSSNGINTSVSGDRAELRNSLGNRELSVSVGLRRERKTFWHWHFCKWLYWKCTDGLQHLLDEVCKPIANPEGSSPQRKETLPGRAEEGRKGREIHVISDKSNFSHFIIFNF